MKTDLTLDQYRTIKLIIELYKSAPSPVIFWRLVKIVLNTYEA